MEGVKNSFPNKGRFHKIEVIQYLHFFVLLVCVLIELFEGEATIGHGVFKLLLLLFFYNFYFKTVKALFYSYWTFWFFNFLFVFISWVTYVGGDYPRLTYLYFLALFLLLIDGFAMFSPIYFPIIPWWVYDFRYRGDLKIVAQLDDKNFEGRLTDLRRSAGCVVLFDNLTVGDVISISTSEEIKEITLRAKVVTKREYITGRGYFYGIQFLYDNLTEKKEIDKFCSDWSAYHKAKLRMKFHKVEL